MLEVKPLASTCTEHRQRVLGQTVPMLWNEALRMLPGEGFLGDRGCLKFRAAGVRLQS